MRTKKGLTATFNKILHQLPCRIWPERLSSLVIIIMCFAAAYLVLSQPFGSHLARSAKGGNKIIVPPSDGVRIETAIVGSCNVGMAEKRGASDVCLAMSVAQCPEVTVANLKITNRTSTWRRNVEIACVQLSADGSMLAKSVLAIAEDIPPNSTIAVNGLALQSIDARTARMECAVLGAERF